jgi:hypothetical protein
MLQIKRSRSYQISGRDLRQFPVVQTIQWIYGLCIGIQYHNLKNFIKFIVHIKQTIFKKLISCLKKCPMKYDIDDLERSRV